MLHTTLNNRRLILLIAIGLTLAAALAALAIVSGQARDTSRTQGESFGKARTNSDADVVLRVNGYPVTNAELVERRLRYYRNLQSMKNAVERVVPADQWHEVASDADFASNNPRSPVHEDFITEDFKARIRSLETHGADAVALASFISRYADFSAALAAGHEASETEIVEYAEITRAAFEQHLASENSAWGPVPEMQGYIEAVGENRFWSEIYPEQLARDIAIGKWHQAAIDEYNGGEDIGIHVETTNKILDELRLAAIADVDIEVIDADKVGVDPEAALEYLREGYTWDAAFYDEYPTDATLIQSELDMPASSE